MGKRVKGKQGKEQGQIVKVPKVRVEDCNKRTPLFCMEYMTDDRYDLNCCDDVAREAFFDALKRRCVLTWNDINQQGRTELGTEIIPPKKIKIDIPHNFGPNLGLNILSLHTKGKTKNRIMGVRMGEYSIYFGTILMEIFTHTMEKTDKNLSPPVYFYSCIA